MAEAITAPRYLKLSEAAVYARESTSSIRRRIAHGQLTAHRKPATVPGARARLLLIDIHELDALINGGK